MSTRTGKGIIKSLLLATIAMEQQLSNGDALSDSELYQSHTLIHNHTLSVIGVISLKCAVELGIADIIHAQGRSVSLLELARSIPIPAERDPMLRRLMRLLVARGVFSGDEVAYSLTPFSQLLLRTGINMSAYVLAVLDQALVNPLLFTSAWFKTKGTVSTPFELTNDGRQFWEVMNERPELNELFNEAMASTARWVMRAVVHECAGVFRGLKTIVDVGGGTGTSVRTIMEAFPEVKCTLFDLPHVVATVKKESEAFDVVGGDMFESIPHANAVFLKSILHDWGDEDCVKILRRCKEAISPREDGGKVIIVDIVVNSQPDNKEVTDTQLFYDVTMMVSFGGKEREEFEWRKIFYAAEFKDYKIFPLLGIHSVIELYP